ncbi:Thiosulfate sulfurtransferase GlpE [Halomonadaceae bacterium LMG 33818]|uniref:thiosulfate sulfurtransferase GlpE n=1 Tax=Cernens ardua TaxID=3402176 RepID=UPI003EDCA127
MNFTHLDASTLNQWLEEKASLALVDIRDPMSYDSGHITGSTRLDNGNLPAFIAEGDKTTPVVVVCYHGNSSQGAAAYLAEQGFETVYSLDGGFTEWQNRYPDSVSS